MLRWWTSPGRWIQDVFKQQVANSKVIDITWDVNYNKMVEYTMM